MMKKWALVTGGGGFLGQYIVEALLKRGDRVRVLARGNYPELKKLGVELIQGNIMSPEDTDKATQNCDTIFHTAARVGVFGPYPEFYDTNVIGTQNLLNSAKKNHVPKFIFTSSSSVIYNGKDQINIDENTPYPKKYLSPYSQTKALSEKLVLDANGPDLMTVAIRPHLIWGPRDRFIIPSIIQRAKEKKIWIVGNGKNLTDITYVENCAEAHLLAEQTLNPDSNVGGKAYFITQGKPVLMWSWINEILERLQLPPVTKHAPVWLLYGFGAALESVYHLLHLDSEPLMTRLIACQLSTSHTYSIENARKDFGYEPRISTEDGLERVFQWLNH